MFIVAHRGFHKNFPENTLNAFKAAIGIADFVEMDIHKTKDNKLIVYHNPTITIGKKKLFIEDLTYAEIFNQNRTGPLFETVLKELKGKIKLLIEIKSKNIETEVLTLIKKYLKYNDFGIISFDYKTLHKIKQLDPKVHVGLIIGLLDLEIGLFRSLVRFIYEYLFTNKILEKYNIDFIGAGEHTECLFFHWTKKNKKIFVWTVDVKRINKYLSKKYEDTIEGIITNEPDLAKKLLKNRLIN